jgi:hypothetical protein
MKATVDAYVDTPEFLDRVESDDLLEQIIPVVTLNRKVSGQGLGRIPG